MTTSQETPKKQKNTRIKRMMSVIIAAFIIAGLFFFYEKSFITKETLPKAVIINTDNQPVLGNTSAKIHIVSFEDLKCMNCARFNNAVFPAIKKKYIDTGIANYTMINLAFVPGSMPAANAARCVYQQNSDAFFDYVDAIFKNQPPENQNWATIPTLLTFAANVKGIDTDLLADCLIKSPHTSFIENNLQTAIAVMTPPVSTPTVYINGVLVKPLTEEQIDRVIKAVK